MGYVGLCFIGMYDLSSINLNKMFGDGMMGSIAVVVLGLADPAAAWVGRRWGQIQLVNGRTLEGSMAFALVGTISAFGVMAVCYPSISMWMAFAISFMAGVVGAITELLCRRVDDNLAIPLMVGGAVYMVMHFGG